MNPICFRVLRLLRLFRNVKTLCFSKASLPLVSGALALVPRNQAFVAFPELKEIQTQKNVEYTTALSRLAPFIAARRYYARRPVFVCSSQSDRVHFKGDPIMDVPSLSPRSSDSSLSLSPHLSTNPLHSASSIPSWAPRPRVYTPPQPPIIPPVYLNSHLIAPSLNYDMRFHPDQSKLRLSPAALAKRATRPPSSSLPIRVAGLPWTYIVRPDPNVTHENAVVTTHDVLIALHSYLLKVVNAGEYNAMSKARKADISRQFEWRVRNDPDQRGKGLRRVDVLGGCVRAQGLVRAELQNNIWVWNVVVR
ncbi:hypothetical protein EI94DRAFT_1703738 [Lactarius quietus]|nr:hypothetical protein EI94DRAFT_1703738 [Lactarius quietus]